MNRCCHQHAQALIEQRNCPSSFIEKSSSIHLDLFCCCSCFPALPNERALQFAAGHWVLLLITTVVAADKLSLLATVAAADKVEIVGSPLRCAHAQMKHVRPSDNQHAKHEVSGAEHVYPHERSKHASAQRAIAEQVQLHRTKAKSALWLVFSFWFEQLRVQHGGVHSKRVGGCDAQDRKCDSVRRFQLASGPLRNCVHEQHKHLDSLAEAFHRQRVQHAQHGAASFLARAAFLLRLLLLPLRVVVFVVHFDSQLVVAIIVVVIELVVILVVAIIAELFAVAASFLLLFCCLLTIVVIVVVLVVVVLVAIIGQFLLSRHHRAFGCDARTEDTILFGAVLGIFDAIGRVTVQSRDTGFVPITTAFVVDPDVSLPDHQ